MEPDLIILGIRLKEARRKKGMTMRDVADKLDVSESYIYRLENSTRIPTTVIARKKVEDFVKDGGD